MGQHAAVEFERRHQRRFDMQMRIDEAGHGKPPPPVDHRLALVARMGAHDPVGDDGDIGLGDRRR